MNNQWGATKSALLILITKLLFLDENNFTHYRAWCGPDQPWDLVLWWSEPRLDQDHGRSNREGPGDWLGRAVSGKTICPRSRFSRFSFGTLRCPGRNIFFLPEARNSRGCVRRE